MYILNIRCIYTQNNNIIIPDRPLSVVGIWIFTRRGRYMYEMIYCIMRVRRRAHCSFYYFILAYYMYYYNRRCIVLHIIIVILLFGTFRMCWAVGVYKLHLECQTRSSRPTITERIEYFYKRLKCRSNTAPFYCCWVILD